MIKEVRTRSVPQGVGVALSLLLSSAIAVFIVVAVGYAIYKVVT